MNLLQANQLRFVHHLDQLDATVHCGGEPSAALLQSFVTSLSPGLFPAGMQEQIEREIHNFFYCLVHGATKLSGIHLRTIKRILES